MGLRWIFGLMMQALLFQDKYDCHSLWALSGRHRSRMVAGCVVLLFVQRRWSYVATIYMNYLFEGICSIHKIPEWLHELEKW